MEFEIEMRKFRMVVFSNSSVIQYEISIVTSPLFRNSDQIIDNLNPRTDLEVCFCYKIVGKVQRLNNVYKIFFVNRDTICALIDKLFLRHNRHILKR